MDNQSMISRQTVDRIIKEELSSLQIMDEARLKAIESKQKEIIMLEGELKASDYTRRMLNSILDRSASII